ncbi:hypothetical protein VNO77_24189 [Canavalia gladiata]|uniref:Uncharacterized protein n=1 Tax=Canavalia gladiata TaxID=3824 RepID=A0AAN9Q9N0_CANGL
MVRSSFKLCKRISIIVTFFQYMDEAQRPILSGKDPDRVNESMASSYTLMLSEKPQEHEKRINQAPLKSYETIKPSLFRVSKEAPMNINFILFLSWDDQSNPSLYGLTFQTCTKGF